MRKALLVATVVAGLGGVPIVASSQEAMTGAAGGAAAGAVVGGPVGAVVGGVVGGAIGAGAEAERRERDAEGRVVVQERGAVLERTCVDDGVKKTCTETGR